MLEFHNDFLDVFRIKKLCDAILLKGSIGKGDDPKGLFDNFTYDRADITEQKVAKYFSEILYYFVEVDTAYKRKNYAWTARSMGTAIAIAAVLLRYPYNKKYTFLELKKINEIITPAQYQ